ncbi:MAG: response regulator [Candidatus Staskawiczbacteria bacterium]|nr:response regulator [Candidatus Staskawiczbacteria bacterium]
MEKSNKKILIVEDDKEFLWILRQSFDKEGFFVVFAQDGEEGLKMAEEEKPDLVLLDILLPKMDGITMAKKLKEKGINLHIIFLTNLKDAGHIGEAVEIVKETDYIIKSDLHIDQIVGIVKERLGVKA